MWYFVQHWLPRSTQRSAQPATAGQGIIKNINTITGSGLTRRNSLVVRGVSDLRAKNVIMQWKSLKLSA